MSQNFNSILVKNLNIIAVNKDEIKIIIKYIDRILKHKIYFLNNMRYVSQLTTSDALLSLAFFIKITEIIKKYKPNSFKLSQGTKWPELIMNIKLEDEQIQQSQHISDIIEMQSIEYFTKKIEEIQNKIGLEKYSFIFNASCDIFNFSYDESKLDIIYDIQNNNNLSQIAIECKYLSFAFFTQFILKAFTNEENLYLKNQENFENIKKILTQTEIFKDNSSFVSDKYDLEDDFKKSLDFINKNSSYFLQFVNSSIEKILCFNVNKKHKQMKLFNEESKNVLFVSLSDLILEHHIYQSILHLYYKQTKNSIENIKLRILENKFHHIQWLVISYRYECTQYKHYKLIGLKSDNDGLYYEYELNTKINFDEFLAS